MHTRAHTCTHTHTLTACAIHRMPTIRRLDMMQAAAWAGVEKFCWDPCGIFMAGCTWFLILWAEKRAWHYVNFENFIDILLFAIVSSTPLTVLAASPALVVYQVWKT